MAIQAPVYKPVGNLAVKPGIEYTSADIPVGMDVVVLTKGVPQWAKAIDYDGTNLLKDGKIQYARTNVRGVRMKVVDTTVSYPNPNIPGIWKEFESLKFDANTKYTFFDEGIVTFGQVVVV